MRAMLERAGGGVGTMLRAGASVSLAWLAVCLAAAGGQMVPVPIPDADPPSDQAVRPATSPYAAPAATTPVPTAEAPPDTPAVASSISTGRFALVLSDGTRLVGAPGDAKSLPFEGVFGHVEIPMTSIRAVDFAAKTGGGTVHRVHFINGDTITGSVGPWETVRFQTSYGELTVPLASMVSLSADGFMKAPATAVPLAQASKQDANTRQAPVEFVGRPVPAPLIGIAPGPVRAPRPGIVPNGDVE